MTSGPILFQPGSRPDNIKILQLYPHVELFSEGDPPANSLFVQAHNGSDGSLNLNGGDQLLIVDPCADASTRFRLDGQIAVIFTGERTAVDLPLLHTMPGGVAHLRLGEHYIDIYSQKHSNVVVLPALGLLCSGQFGSSASLPLLASGSDGSDELETCLLLARLLRQHRLQLLIPRTGSLIQTKDQALDHLATDVSYLHGLRRVIPPLAQQAEPLEQVHTLAAPLLPRERATPAAEEVHRANVARLYRSCTPLPN